MSKHYELLRRLQRERESDSGDARSLYDLGNERVGAAAVASEPKPQAINQRVIHPEIQKLVQLVFLVQGSAAASERAVLFAPVDSTTTNNIICANAAEALVNQVGKKVCVVDANPLHEPLHEYFGVKNDLGLLSAIQSTDPIEAFCEQTDTPGLTVLPIGPVTFGWQSLLSSETMVARIHELQAQFDYVLIASLPLTGYAQTVVLGQSCDGVVLIVEAETTRKENALAAKRSLEDAHVHVLGAVLNNRTFPIPSALYSRL